MATIMFNPLVDDARRKMGRIVLSKWKHTNYARKFNKPTGAPSEKQLEIRSAFSILVDIWKSFNGVMYASWDKYAKNLDLNMTGFNVFVGKNSAKVRNALPLELFREFGERFACSSRSSRKHFMHVRNAGEFRAQTRDLFFGEARGWQRKRRDQKARGRRKSRVAFYDNRP